MKVLAVVGGGLAGLSATLEAFHKLSSLSIGSDKFMIMLIDKNGNIGGNSAKATSGINAANSRHQQEQGIADSLEAFKRDTIRSGGGNSVLDLVDVLAEESAEAIGWLEKFSNGLRLNQISKCGGHSVPRTHKEQPRTDGKPAPVGWDIVRTLKDYLKEECPHVQVRLNTKLVDVKRDVTGRVNEIKIENHENKFESIPVSALILCTGGYSADWSSTSLLREYIPKSPLFQRIISQLPLSNASSFQDLFPTTNGDFALGEGLKLGMSLGAFTVDLEHIQLHPTGFIDPKNPTATTKFLAPEALRAYGGILVSPISGSRFVNELEKRDVVSEAIFTHCLQGSHAFAYLIMNKHVIEMFDIASVKFYQSKGLVQEVKNLHELSKSLGINEKTLLETMDKYNMTKEKDEFGKDTFPTKFDPNSVFFYAKITPSIHYTMGGLLISPQCQVMRKDEGACIPIPGLYAAGEVSGGVHGQNRLAGNSLLECVVFGRRAGRNSVDFVLSSK